MSFSYLSDTFRKRARPAALLWTLLILLGCLWPGKRLPDVAVPMADKWTHLLLFGGFAFLWLCACPGRRPLHWLLMLPLTTAFGYGIELLQLWLPSLGRSFDLSDVLADTIGGLLGLLAFACFMRLRR